MIWGLLALALAYLLGSVPVGLLVVRARRGRDIRKWYSGRTGATNVMRVAGYWAGLVTVLGDVGKATLAVHRRACRVRGGGGCGRCSGAQLFHLLAGKRGGRLPAERRRRRSERLWRRGGSLAAIRPHLASPCGRGLLRDWLCLRHGRDLRPAGSSGCGTLGVYRLRNCSRGLDHMGLASEHSAAA